MKTGIRVISSKSGTYNGELDIQASHPGVLQSLKKNK